MPEVAESTRHTVVLAAARFIGFLRPDENDRIVVTGRESIYKALGSARFFAAYHADRVEFRNIFRDAHQTWHWAKRFTAEICVQPGHDDSQPTFSQSLNDFDNATVEELYLINGNNGCRRLDTARDF